MNKFNKKTMLKCFNLFEYEKYDEAKKLFVKEFRRARNLKSKKTIQFNDNLVELNKSL